MTHWLPVTRRVFTRLQSPRSTQLLLAFSRGLVASFSFNANSSRPHRTREHFPKSRVTSMLLSSISSRGTSEYLVRGRPRNTPWSPGHGVGENAACDEPADNHNAARHDVEASTWTMIPGVETRLGMRSSESGRLKKTSQTSNRHTQCQKSTCCHAPTGALRGAALH